MNELTVAEKILHTLESQYFADWYEGKFLDYIEGGELAPTREEVLKWIENNFLRD